MSTLTVDGVRLGVAQAGIKYPNKDDLTLIELCEGSTTAAVFTQNAFRAAPVVVAEQHLQQSVRYLLINSGNANAGTGTPGLAAAKDTCASVASQFDVDVDTVLPFSTGVIGEVLPADVIAKAIPQCAENLSASGWDRAAGAILTTDTRSKLRSKTVESEGHSCVIVGMSKGSGMIQPNMATMLGFVATNATIDKGLLQTFLNTAVDQSFNRITVDGDTSTNDAVTLSATGRSSFAVNDITSADAKAFQQALNELCLELAQDIIRDGEGATKFIEIAVSEAESSAEADGVARTIAHSPLVKTALFASDPNWGRILAAIGRAGVVGLDVDAVSLSINGVLIAENGARAYSYSEEAGVQAMASSDLLIEVVLNRGTEGAVVWTTDFSYDYVKINAGYRT